MEPTHTVPTDPGGDRPAPQIGGEGVRVCSRRSWLLALVIVFIAIILLLVVGYWWRFGRLKFSEPYRMALKRVQEAPEVIERLGNPIRDATWLPSGQVYEKGDRGNATVYFVVTGPKGRAEIMAQAQRVGGEWGLVLLDVNFAAGGRVSLAERATRPGTQDLEEAPRWVPPGSGGGP